MSRGNSLKIIAGNAHRDFAEKISETTIKQLIDEADKQMYAEKQQAHRRLRTYV